MRNDYHFCSDYSLYAMCTKAYDFTSIYIYEHASNGVKKKVNKAFFIVSKINTIFNDA